MVILGLGTNLGDRLENLRQALKHIKQIAGLSVQQVSPIYISDAMLADNAPPEWNLPFLNCAIRCDTTLAPMELLPQLQTIESHMGRKLKATHWGPRIIDIDMLAWDDVMQNNPALTLPHKELSYRPFAYWPLSDVAPLWKSPITGKTAAEMVEPWGSRFSGDAPFHTKQINHRIDTPQLMGTVNVTPDSFSDGGIFLDTEKALQHMVDLVNTGANVLDIGAEATSPNASPITSDIEWQRLEGILQHLRQKAFQQSFIVPPKISIDTRHADVAEKALALSVDWINDVTGLQDPAMRDIVASSTADCVMMHHVGIPANYRLHALPREANNVQLVSDWGAKQLDLLEKSGIARERVIFDPGIGFGKFPEQSLTLVQQASVFKQLGVRLLVGHSRKLFFTLLSPQPAQERDIESLAITLALAKQGIDYLRVHNVDISARALRIDAVLTTY